MGGRPPSLFKEKKIKMGRKSEPVTSGCLSPAPLGTETRAKSMYRGLASIVLGSVLFCMSQKSQTGSQQTSNRVITRSVTKSTEGEKLGNGTWNAGFPKRGSRGPSCWGSRPWSLWGPSDRRSRPWRNGKQRGTGTSEGRGRPEIHFYSVRGRFQKLKNVCHLRVLLFY